jgi:hypothetical protein
VQQLCHEQTLKLRCLVLQYAIKLLMRFPLVCHCLLFSLQAFEWHLYYKFNEIALATYGATLILHVCNLDGGTLDSTVQHMYSLCIVVIGVTTYDKQLVTFPSQAHLAVINVILTELLAVLA